jgi:hypothetical protein
MDPVAYRRAAAIALVYTGKDDHYRKLFMRIVDRNKNTMCAGCGNLANRRKKCSVCKYNFCGACNSNYKDKNGQTCYYCNKYVCCTCPMVYKTCYWCEYITCDGCRAKDEDVWMCVDCRDRKCSACLVPNVIRTACCGGTQIEIICEECRVSEGIGFCSACGTITDINDPRNFCASCGEEILCTKCKTNLDETSCVVCLKSALQKMIESREEFTIYNYKNKNAPDDGDYLSE